ncbi:MAG: transporter substrate-binding domain-containing protein [Nitrospirae bacterium]|nr:transporter substrate-binding domain-containing protein [Nitrospirota bacterium]
MYPATITAQTVPALIVGSETDFPPYAIVDAKGHADGFSVELIREVSGVMGLPIDIHTGQWKDILSEFKKGNIDILPLVALSKQRADMAAFTKPHTVTYDSFFVRKGSPPIRSIADAKGKEILVMSSDAAHENLIASGVPVRVVETKTIPDAMRQLALGRHDAVLVSKLIGHMVLRELKLDPAIISGPPINDYNRQFAFAVQPGNYELRDKLDQGIAIVRTTGKYDALYDKWFGGIEPKTEFPWRAIIWIGSIGCLALILISLWIVMLRRKVHQRTAELQKALAIAKAAEEEIKGLNKTLIDELNERKKIENELRAYKNDLEDMVAKRTEELTEVKDRFRTAFEFSTVGVAITSPEKGWIDVNDEACRMLGYSKEELKSMTWAEITHTDDIEPDVTQFNRVLAGEINGYNLEKRFICKNGTIIYTTLLLNCRRSADGSVNYFIAILEDITERKRMEEELKTLNTNLEKIVAEETRKRQQHEQMLIQQSKMASMGEMISMISHQWRQPLNAISLTVQDINDAYNYGEFNEEYIKDVVDTTMGQVTFMAKTIDDFRNFYKPSKERVQFNIITSIEELLSMFGELFKKSDVDISVTAGQVTTPTTEGYPNEFKQVILNIVNNSRDAISSKREADNNIQGLIEINISNNAERDKVIVSIRDNGGGIPEDLINKIFEPYYTTKGEKGSGIGLYMSKTIIEANMGGSLTVRNVDGGAEFLISMCVLADATQA